MRSRPLGRLGRDAVPVVGILACSARTLSSHPSRQNRLSAGRGRSRSTLISDTERARLSSNRRVAVASLVFPRIQRVPDHSTMHLSPLTLGEEIRDRCLFASPICHQTRDHEGRRQVSKSCNARASQKSDQWPRPPGTQQQALTNCERRDGQPNNRQALPTPTEGSDPEAADCQGERQQVDLVRDASKIHQIRANEPECQQAGSDSRGAPYWPYRQLLTRQFARRRG